MSKLAFSLLGCLCALVPATVRTQPPHDAELMARLKTYHYGDDTAVLDAVAAQVTAVRADAARRSQVAQDLAALLTVDAPFEAKQFACRQLAFIGTEAQVPALAGLLADDALAHYALMALARIPGSAVDSALRDALARNHGRTGLEIVEVMADRGDTQAMPVLLTRLGSADSATADAAAFALAKLATHEALQDLLSFYRKASAVRRIALGYALLDGADRLRQHGDPDAARVIIAALDVDADASLRGATLRGYAHISSSAALPQILKALGEDGTPRQLAADGLVRELPDSKMTAAFAAALPHLTAHGKRLLLAALADRGDRAAATAVRAQCGAPDAEVRVAALAALGSLGDVTCLGALLSAAANGTPEEREAARNSLTQLRGATVEVRLSALLDTAPARQRAEIIAALGRRRAKGTLPRLLQEAHSATPAVRLAALRVLRDMGPPPLLPALVDLLLSTPVIDRDATIDTVSAVARRGVEERQRTGPLLARLGSAERPVDKVSLLTLLGQVGGPGALTALRGALTDPNAEVQAAALSVLADWPTDEPLHDLLRAARATRDGRQRTLALRGYLRMIGAGEGRVPTQTLALYRDVAPLVTRPDERRLLLGGLAKSRSLAALEFATGFVKDDSVRAEAEAAVVAIGASTLGAWPDKTRAALAPIAQHGVNEATRQRATATLARLEKMGDFVPAWEASPAYERDGMDYTRLFDLAFPPEGGVHAKEVVWQPIPIGTDPEHPWLLDLLALWGGEQRVAYLRTGVWSETARDLALEMGSDDGVKAWWNGHVVLAHNVARAVAPAEERVFVSLHPGWNILLLKITQNIMGWGACARFTMPDGSPAVGLRYAIPSAITADH